jgi:hypothetical protein
MAQRIELEWKGKSYVIREEQAFALGEELEDIVTITELAAMGDKPKFYKLSRAYAAIITFAGGHATPAEVHGAIMDGVKAGESAGADVVMTVVNTLISILMDGAPDGDDAEAGGTDPNRDAPSSVTAMSGQSAA